MIVCKILIQIQIITTQTQTWLKNSLDKKKKNWGGKESTRSQQAYYKSETASGKQKPQNIIRYKTALK